MGLRERQPIIQGNYQRGYKAHIEGFWLIWLLEGFWLMRVINSDQWPLRAEVTAQTI